MFIYKDLMYRNGPQVVTCEFIPIIGTWWKTLAFALGIVSVLHYSDIYPLGLLAVKSPMLFHHMEIDHLE